MANSVDGIYTPKDGRVIGLVGLTLRVGADAEDKRENAFSSTIGTISRAVEG